MKIQILEPGNMVPVGSYLLRSIQNNSTPIVDLLVRESIQNSLDAHIDDKTTVRVDFVKGEYVPSVLNEIFDSITEKLNQNYCNSNSFLAIRDYGTVGLTGELHASRITNHNYGNLYKLVYDFGKPQENIGSGGSWGIGKTLFNRIGNGIVIFYSRIAKSNDTYESRLAACIIENQNKSSRLLDKQNSTGIAWWGDSYNNQDTIPLTKESDINKILEIFKLQPYKENETGTTVIVPYLDEKRICADNKKEDNKQYWQDSSLEEHLKIAIQRWYFPRLLNNCYPGPKLKVQINGVTITRDNDIQPFFKLYQSLYNKAIDSTVNIQEDYLSENNLQYKVDRIELRSEFEHGKLAGSLAYGKFSKQALCPDNQPSPFTFLGFDDNNTDAKPPILAFCRKPGMIVSYEIDGDWLHSVPSTDYNEFVIAIFVLNSENQLKVSDPDLRISLEEYIRQGERADHSSWNDYNLGKVPIRIVQKLKKNVSSKLKNFLHNNDTPPTEKTDSGLSQWVGSLMLPSNGYGISANTRHFKQMNGNSKTNSRIKSQLNGSPIFGQGTITLEYQINRAIKHKELTVRMFISSATGSVDLDTWETDMGLDLPFEIEKLELYDNNVENSCMTFNKKNPQLSTNQVEGNLCMSSKEKFCGFKVKFKNDNLLSLTMRLTLRLYYKDSKPIIQIN